MGVFNSSAYRQFYHSYPPRLLLACVVLLFIGLTPLSILVVRPEFFISTSLLLLPILAIAGAGLLEVGRRETDPLTLIDRLCSLKRMKKHLLSMVPRIDSKITETKKLELSKPGDRPTHEFDWHLPVWPEKDDPISSLAALGLLAVRHADSQAFTRILKRCFEALEFTQTFPIKGSTAGEYRIRSDLHDNVFGALQRMTLALQQDKGTVYLARVAIDTFAEFIVEQTKRRKQTEDLTFSAIRLMEVLSRHCYENGSTRDIRIPIIVARQIVQKGMDDPPPIQPGQDVSVEISMFHHQLPNVTACIKRLGSFAIAKGDTEFLYRCLDAFGWLGCSAVKLEHVAVVTECLRALSQLGREARAADLECFWDRCPVRPVDHAVERVDWIASWLAQVPSDRRQNLAELANCAYSRLTGQEITLKFKQASDGKLSIEKVFSEKKHVESYIMQAAARNVDYSDFAFLKDLEMHGGKGVLVQGPSVPFC
jgi:hypothetical protein